MYAIAVVRQMLKSTFFEKIPFTPQVPSMQSAKNVSFILRDISQIALFSNFKALVRAYDVCGFTTKVSFIFELVLERTQKFRTSENRTPNFPNPNF